MNMKLEVVIVPVSDVDRAKAFYEKLGFRLDIDIRGWRFSRHPVHSPSIRGLDHLRQGEHDGEAWVGGAGPRRR